MELCRLQELVNSEVLNTKAVEQLLRRAGLGRGNARRAARRGG
jgi:hypothetical protein